jgi:PAS domain S-box-containing protein
VEFRGFRQRLVRSRLGFWPAAAVALVLLLALLLTQALYSQPGQAPGSAFLLWSGPALAVLALLSLGLAYPRRLQGPDPTPLDPGLSQPEVLQVLRENLAKFSNDPAMLLDERGRLLDANEGTLGLYGWTREELLQKNIRELIHPDMLSSMEQRWSKVPFKDGQIFESIHVRKDGNAFPVEINSRRFLIGDQEVRQTFIRDITERKQAERKLQAAVDQLRLLVDSVNGIVWESDPVTLYITFVSRQAEQLLGFPQEQWLVEPKFWRNHLHPDDREKTIAYFDEHEARLEPFTAEYRMVAVDGRTVWIREIIMVTAKDDRPVKLHGVMVDITERKQVEAELERARDFYFTVLDKLPNPVWQTGPDGHHSFLNKAWLEFTGQNLEKALEGHWLDLAHPEDVTYCRERYAAAIVNRDSFALDYRALFKDGTYHEIRNYGKPLFFKDQFMGYVGILNDLHALRNTERNLLRVKDLYAALSQTDQLIIHASDQKSLFQKICLIATKQAKFKLAWVGLADSATALVRVAAVEGPAHQFPTDLEVFFNESPLGRGPTGTCIQKGRPQIVNDFIADDSVTPWLGLAGQYGIRAAASFPLRKSGKVIGALTLYSEHPGFFDHDRVELLKEMAQDISFALDRLSAEEERKAMEAALRESETNLAKAQEIAQIGSWIWDVRHNHGHWSKGMEKIYGFPFEEGPNHLERVLKVVHPEDQVHYQSRIKRLIANGGTLETTYRIIRADGEVRVFFVNAVAEQDQEGKTVLVRGITQDITDRKRAEEKVRETLRNLEDFKAAVDESAVVLVTDAEGLITYVNHRMCEITGYSREELIGSNPRILGSMFHPRAYFQEMWEIISSGGIWRGEVRNRAKDGTFHWLDTTIVPFLDEGGNPVQYMAIRFDITDRKLAEDKVMAISAERMALLEAASVAKVVPWSLDLATGNLRMGDSALLVLGKPAVTFHAHPNALRELLKPEDQKQLIHAQAEARAGMLGTFEAPLKRGEKQIIWTRWTIGRREGHLHGVVQDITEQHELYSQLLQSQKLESLGTLVGGITHDFNNILMGILGYTEVISSMPDLPANAQKGLSVIGRAAERGRGLVNQLLRFSRRTVASKVMYNLNDVLREVQSLMQLPGDASIELQLHLDPSLPETLMDPGQINQVAMNLAVNARDAIAGKGTIHFRTGRTVMSPQEASELGKQPGSYLFLEIEDTGAGIRPELVSRIFEPFFTTKGVGKGTGLGLSVVHGIVEAHGGHIQCHSTLGKGTRFRVMLPCITPETVSHEAEGTVPVQVSHRILLLDDAGHARSTAADLLIYMGNFVLAEGDVQHAIGIHHGEPFHLAIVNLDMAGGAGAGILKTLQEAVPDIPAIAGISSEAPDLTALKAQPHALIQWPFRAVELLSAIQRILG